MDCPNQTNDPNIWRSFGREGLDTNILVFLVLLHENFQNIGTSHGFAGFGGGKDVERSQPRHCLNAKSMDPNKIMFRSLCGGKTLRHQSNGLFRFVGRVHGFFGTQRSGK